MNISTVITALKSDHGLDNISLPFKDKITGRPVPIEVIITTEVIQNVTIPRYSEFVPWIRTCEFPISRLKCIDERRAIYLLPAILTQTPVRYIIDVSLPNHNNRGTYGDIAPAYGINRSVQGVATSMGYMMVAGQMRAEPTFEDLGFNKVRLYGYPKTNVEFKVACNHLPNLESVEDSCYDSFMDLATLDLEVYLYENLKYYESLPTPYGDYKLRLEDYQGAREARKALLEDWRDRFHLDFIDYIEFFN